ncbi:hypothetical protein OH77DRAFT_1421071 [Trametes cingulata]|nr:hypothetical protein OH77DRAFT_1421071 [Trametes cingulata]
MPPSDAEPRCASVQSVSPPAVVQSPVRPSLRCSVVVANVRAAMNAAIAVANAIGAAPAAPRLRRVVSCREVPSTPLVTRAKPVEEGPIAPLAASRTTRKKPRTPIASSRVPSPNRKTRNRAGRKNGR